MAALLLWFSLLGLSRIALLGHSGGYRYSHLSVGLCWCSGGAQDRRRAVLLYLAYRSARSALAATRPQTFSRAEVPRVGYAALYRRGVLLHLTNPKAVLAWMAIMTLGLKPDATLYTLAAILGGCFVLGIIINGGYALVFSTSRMVYTYQKAQRWIEGMMAVFFGFAGLRLLSAK